VLLVRSGSIPAETANELARLRPLRIVVVGGSAAISNSVAQQLQKLAGG
jgi:putative cell wall-binding protein